MNDGKRQRLGACPAILVFFLVMALALPLRAADWAPARMAKSVGPEALGQFPDSASAVRRMLAAAHAARDGARVRAGLRALAGMGYAPSRETIDLLSPYLPGGEQVDLARRFAVNRAPAGTSRLYASVPAERRLIEGIARDPRTGRLFASSVVGRELLVFERGAWRAIPGLDAGSLFGMAVDAPRRRLWIASGSVEQTPHPETAFRGLIALDLDSFRVTARVALTGSPGDVTVGRDGVVYASDPVNGTVFRLRPGDRGALLAIQNGINPHRIVRLRLDRSGDMVIGVDILERANPAWGEPTLGTIAGGDLLYVADGQWERYGAGGAETGTARPTAIRALSVEAGLHRARGPRVGVADQRQRSGHGKRALADRAGRRLVLTAGPRNDGFASHRTTFLTGFGTDHRVKRPPDECIMS